MTAERLGPDLRVRNSVLADADAIVALSRSVYPGAPPYTPKELVSQIATFPEGHFVVTTGTGQVVAMSACLLVDDERVGLLASWSTITAQGTIATHDPSGDTLYGFETMVHPVFQRKGIASTLFFRRIDLARQLGARLFRGAGRLAGYARVSQTLTAADYLQKLRQGELEDPTLSWILRNGLRIRALVPDYLEDDPESLGWAVAVDYPIGEIHRIEGGEGE